MSDKLRTYIKKNKEKFDSSGPSDELWKKIDSKLEVRISKGKWISNLKYFGFGASVIAIAVYFVSQNLDDSSSKALSQNLKDSALNSSGVWVKTNQNDENVPEGSVENSVGNRSGDEDSANKNLKEQGSLVTDDRITEKDSAITNVSESPVNEEKVEVDPLPVKEEKTVPTSAINKNKRRITPPEVPTEMNAYNAVLYDNTSLCEVVQAYKFPGKVNMDDKGNFQGRRILETVPCSKLEASGNVKAVWLKGKPIKKIEIAIKEGFKNITLIKSNGTKFYPVAVSHYYKGLGVISDYNGKHCEMIFKDKVELILFFTDAEDGDKVIVDGKIEAVVVAK